MRGVDSFAANIADSGEEDFSFAGVDEGVFVDEWGHAELGGFFEPGLDAGIVFVVAGAHPDTVWCIEICNGFDRAVERGDRTIDPVSGVDDHVCVERVDLVDDHLHPIAADGRTDMRVGNLGNGESVESFWQIEDGKFVVDYSGLAPCFEYGIASERQGEGDDACVGGVEQETAAFAIRFDEIGALASFNEELFQSGHAAFYKDGEVAEEHEYDEDGNEAKEDETDPVDGVVEEAFGAVASQEPCQTLAEQ